MITIKTADGLTHGPIALLLSGEPDVEKYAPDSVATQAVLNAAYAAGDYERYTPSEPLPESPEPNWQDFRLALLQTDSFREWSERLPATWREDLKLAAIAANVEALQSIYDLLAHQHTPDYAAALEWQAIATANHISVNFG